MRLSQIHNLCLIQQRIQEARSQRLILVIWLDC